MQDMCVPCGEGLINLRVGAIIEKNGKLLMAGNRARPEYFYSVGGRIQFGETAEEALRREVREETGVPLEIDRLGFVHENYFYGDAPGNFGKLIYELCLYFYMKTPPDFEPVSDRFDEGGQEELLVWLAPDGPARYYPEFLRTELPRRAPGVKYIVTDERRKPGVNRDVLFDTQVDITTCH